MIHFSGGLNKLFRKPRKISGTTFALETHEISAEEAFDDLSAPGETGEQLWRREWNVIEVTDLEIGALGSQHRGN
jgi:hypothetical protein